jgi:hypothetical protein
MMAGIATSRAEAPNAQIIRLKSLFVLMVLIKTRKNKTGSMKYAFQSPNAAILSLAAKTEIVAKAKNKMIKYL